MAEVVRTMRSSVFFYSLVRNDMRNKLARLSLKTPTSVIIPLVRPFPSTIFLSFSRSTLTASLHSADSKRQQTCRDIKFNTMALKHIIFVGIYMPIDAYTQHTCATNVLLRVHSSGHFKLKQTKRMTIEEIENVKANAQNKKIETKTNTK